MPGIFGDLDLESAKDNPNEIPRNTYHCLVTGMKIARTSSGDKLGVTFTFTIMDGDYASKKVTEWKQIPEPSDPKNMTEEEANAASYLKQRLLSFGVPADKVNDVTPDDIVGKVEVDVSVDENPKRPGFPQVRRVALHDAVVDFSK